MSSVSASFSRARPAAAHVVCGLLMVQLARVGANTFLARDPSSLEEGGSDLLLELELVAGQSGGASIAGRASLLEEALRPTFQALPRDGSGHISGDAARYLLHRLFVDRHGWFVRGLDARGEAWNSSSPADVFESHAGDVHSLFKQRLGVSGFTLHEVAVLGATLESFVHEETVDRLRSAYRLSSFSEFDGSTTEAQVQKAMDAYMMMYVLGLNHTTTTHLQLAANAEIIDQTYPHWQETKAWVREVRADVLAKSDGSISVTSLDSATRVLEEIAGRYGRWQDKECRQIKSSLLKLEHGSSGRVRLETFYGSALGGNWQFSESKAYLQELGALDESDPLRPSVIIPNYVNAPTNCVASSKFYSVCCIDECEALLGHLEERIAAPSASPARIVELVSKLPSATVDAPRTLPAELVGRLEDIAQHHGGKVPFHGRLFAQWLHHAYPRDCPFPQLSGTSKPATPEQWTEQTGEQSEASEDAMRRHIAELRRSATAGGSAATPGGNASAKVAIPWSAEEELFVGRAELPAVTFGLHRAAVLAMLCAVASGGLYLGRFASVAFGAAGSTAPHKELKHLV